MTPTFYENIHGCTLAYEISVLLTFPIDYTLHTREVTITPAMTRPCVQFTAVADDLGLEGVENFQLVLSAPSRNVQLGNATLDVSIEDADSMWYNV